MQRLKRSLLRQHKAAAAHVGSLKQAVVSEKVDPTVYVRNGLKYHMDSHGNMSLPPGVLEQENAKQIAELRRQYAVAEADIAACKLGRDKAEAALKKQGIKSFHVESSHTSHLTSLRFGPRGRYSQHEGQTRVLRQAADGLEK